MTASYSPVGNCPITLPNPLYTEREQDKLLNILVKSIGYRWFILWTLNPDPQAKKMTYKDNVCTLGIKFSQTVWETVICKHTYSI